MVVYRITVCLLIAIWLNPVHSQAEQTPKITPSRLSITLDQVSEVYILNHESSFQSSTTEYTLTVKGA